MPRQRSRRASNLLLISVSVLLWLLACGAPAQPPDTPVLRIEAGMHTAPIMRIDVDAQERFLVTASDDKTARVWSLAGGELLQVLRPPLGDGQEGQLYAVAIAPDGGSGGSRGCRTSSTTWPTPRTGGIWQRPWGAATASASMRRATTAKWPATATTAATPTGPSLTAAGVW
jgi:hypothetical protein